MQINSLTSGGLITNYHCSSKCGHCLYASSPSRPKDYINNDICSQICTKLKQMRCSSVHIGGGEPLLDFGEIYRILEILKEERINIEYIETNSSWY
ncbi:MAG: 4Fe-4S cluster-binding domain-containing protein, partial [Planctomycetota bacterium]